MNDTKYTPVLVSYSLRNSKQPGFCQNSQVPRPLRITRLSEPFVGFPNNVRRRAHVPVGRSAAVTLLSIPMHYDLTRRVRGGGVGSKNEQIFRLHTRCRALYAIVAAVIAVAAGACAASP